MIAEVADIFFNPDFDGKTFNNDIALVRLTEPVPFSDYVRPACIATSSDELQDYRRCLVAGWGYTAEGGGMSSFSSSSNSDTGPYTLNV